MPKPKPERYVLGAFIGIGNMIWPEGGVVHVVPLTDLPNETLVDVYYTDNPAHAMPVSGAKKFRARKSALIINGNTLKLKDEDGVPDESSAE